jgi:hypothetical protein
MTQVGEKSFIDYSKEIAERFLQTVVAVDDSLSFSDDTDTDIEIVEPDEDSGLGTGLDNPAVISPQKHSLNYQALSLAFANKGIICSGLMPTVDQQNSINMIFQSSKNADITILDWQMDGRNQHGTLATSAIKKLAANDIAEGGRLRVIAIYTGAAPATIAEALHDSLRTDFEAQIDNTTIKLSKASLEHWQIIVINKNSKNEEQLTSNLIESFTELTAGLLSNAALATITDIREKTHNFLHKFNNKLDPAYLSHVLGLISSPDMREHAHEVAFDYAVELMSEELKSGIQISPRIKNSLTSEILLSWPGYVNKEQEDNFFNITVGDLEPVEFGTTRLREFIAATTEEELTATLLKAPTLGKPKRITDRFEKLAIKLMIRGEDDIAHSELSAIECLRRDCQSVGSHIPVLKLGTILRCLDTEEYLICVQPVCDSVRISDITNFMFLAVDDVDSNKSFSHVLRVNESKFTNLCVNPVASYIRNFKFEPDGSCRVIKADNHNKTYYFHDFPSYGDSRTFKWLGELKQGVAQAISNTLGAKISRVGYDSFEWLRQK